MELSGALDSNALVPDYLEATIYSEEDAVIMIGNFADVTTDDQRRKVRDVVIKEMFEAVQIR
jgi:delta24-sterol reductase